MSSAGTDSYTLQMLDRISAPLRRVEERMEKLSGLMERVQGLAGSGGSGGLTGALGGVGRAAAVAGGALAVAGAGLYGLYKAMEFGIGLTARFAVSFGKAVLAAAQLRQQNIGALNTFLGEGRGEGAFNRALDIGGITPADERDVLGQVRELASAGYKGQGLSRANAALLDVQSLLGKENSDNLKYYFRKFYGGQKVEADDLRQSAFSAGLTETDLQRRIVGNAGLTPKTGKGLGDQFAGLKKAGQITGQDVIKALEQGINEKLDKGKGLGSAALAAGDSLEGLLSNLSAAPERFFAQIQLEKLPGIQALKEFLGRLLNFFKLATPEGKALARTVEDITNTLFGGLKNISNDDLGRFFRSGLEVAERLRSTISSAWEVLDQLLHGDTGGFTKALGNSLIEVGKLIGVGIWQGLWSTTGGEGGKSKAAIFRDNVVGKELGEQALRAGDLASIYQRAGGSTNAPGFRATVQYLSERNLTGDLARQVEEAQKRLGLGPTSRTAALLEEAGSEAFEGIKGGFKKAGKIESPSRVLFDLGEEAFEGLKLGTVAAMHRSASDGSGAGSTIINVERVEVLYSSDTEEGRAREFAEQLVQELRRVALRVGAPVARGAGS